jgi:hypothetical protein
MDDELARLKPSGSPAGMQRWNIEDLQAYVAAMQAEITHVESMIAEKTRFSQQPMPYLALVIRPFVTQPLYYSILGFGWAPQWLHPIS